MSQVDVMKSEERRALVLLGITAVLASVLATMYALIWTNSRKLEDFYFNFPCTAVPHLTVYDVSLLEPLIRTWIVYAVFAFFYFSEDWFQGKNGERFRTFCHVFAAFFMGYYFLQVVWYVPGLYALIVWIPGELAGLYLLAVAIGLSYTEIVFVEMATGTRGATKQLLVRLWNWTGKPVLTATRPRLMLLLARLWDKHGNRLPLPLRNRLVGLRRSINPGARQRKLFGGRVKKLLIYGIALVTFLLLILFRLYCG